MNKPTVPYRWTGGGFERAGDDMTATLQTQRFDGAPGIEAGWQADDKFNISSFRESRPPLTGLGKDLRATATITKWCEGGNWNGPLRVRFEVSLPNGASKVIDLDTARRASDAATYEALPDSRLPNSIFAARQQHRAWTAQAAGRPGRTPWTGRAWTRSA